MQDKQNDHVAVAPDIDVLVDEFLTRKQNGDKITIEDFADLHASHREEVLKVLPAVDYLESSNPNTWPEPLQTHDLPKILLGEYKISRLIGFGGMGTVYEAEHFLRSKVALKVMISNEESDSRRFEREAKILAGLHHPNIVPVFDFGATEESNYMSMRYIDGPNLSQVLAAKRRQNKPTKPAKRIARKLEQNPKFLAHIGYQVACALNYAHREGILHRDIKPANLLIENDHVWVTDFGLAKPNNMTSSITQTGNAVGTLQYMAPEQLDNESDERSDIYSLGFTLYQLAVNSEKSSSAIFARHPLERPRSTNPCIPRGLEQVILKACEPNPDDRYQTAEELAYALKRYCNFNDQTHSGYITTPIRSMANWIMLASAVVLAAVIAFKTIGTPPPETIFECALTKDLDISPTRVVYQPSTGISTMVTRVIDVMDDAEEWDEVSSYPRGKLYFDSADLELVWDQGKQWIGIRFSRPFLPKGAEIVSAYIQFTCYESDIGETNLRIQGDKSPYSDPFTQQQFGISSRAKTTAEVSWTDIPQWFEGHADKPQRTPDLSEIVREIISQEGWESDNPLTFLFSGSGKRCAASRDSGKHLAPKLILEYRTASHRF
ncbi:MAG: serine/threonine-protein kinase [Planctomycetota bacterium]